MNMRAIADIRVMESELTIYIEDNFASPASLAAIGRATLLDPWGNPYVYLALDTGQGGRVPEAARTSSWYRSTATTTCTAWGWTARARSPSLRR